MQLLVCAHTQGRVSRGLPIPQVRMACWDRLLATACELAFLSLRRSFISLSMARKGKEGTNTFIGKTSPVSDLPVDCRHRVSHQFSSEWADQRAGSVLASHALLVEGRASHGRGERCDRGVFIRVGVGNTRPCAS
eukprot:scaffold11203_cov32-Tisochrysis_lutea.AAC.1